MDRSVHPVLNRRYNEPGGVGRGTQQHGPLHNPESNARPCLRRSGLWSRADRRRECSRAGLILTRFTHAECHIVKFGARSFFPPQRRVDFPLFGHFHGEVSHIKVKTKVVARNWWSCRSRWMGQRDNQKSCWTCAAYQMQLSSNEKSDR